MTSLPSLSLKTSSKIEMELEHLSHEHPLILEEEHKGDEVEVSCYGCRQPISGPSYNCKQCKHFSLHKVCAKLPKQIEHPMHPQHPLFLFPNPSHSQTACECSVCQRPCKGFTYICFPCKFEIDLLCALMMWKIEHECHKHALTPLQRPALFLCDACGTRHEGPSYQCTTCQFWVNQNCASLPSTINYSGHHHLLHLTYYLSYEHFRFTSYCKICIKFVDRAYWAYYCAECKYFAHVNCLTSKAKLSSESEIKLIDQERKTRVEKVDPHLVSLPQPDESINLIERFMKKIGIHGDSKKEREIYHVSHHHPLLFVDINNESCSKSKQLACDGCTQPILTPFYHCAECNFVLHECCAELSIEVQHPCHPNHPLILNRWHSIFSDHLPQCQGCKMSCNGILFGCVACDFFLDIRCASLLGNIMHESHQHFLTLKETDGVLCTACNKKFYGVGLVCDICNYKLDTRCALLSCTIRHRYDKHPFSLLYFGTEDEYYCEICEEEINPNCWFYHCGDCNQSLHTECISPVSSLQQQFITHEAHMHTLALKETSKVPCAACKYNCSGFGFVCDSCDFVIHSRCAFLPHTVKHRNDEIPFILSYSREGTYYSPRSPPCCAICGGALRSQMLDCWFYSCGGKSHKYAHTICIQIDEYPNIKIGDKLNVGSHPHLLTYVEDLKHISSCNRCGKLAGHYWGIEGRNKGFECETCNFWLHFDCARNVANQRILELQQMGKLKWLDPIDRKLRISPQLAPAAVWCMGEI
ncbi:unnamed protein product [Camellia sinensis]